MIGEIKDVTPTTKVEFIITLPIRSPSVMPLWPDKDDLIAKLSSGSDVPKANKNIPISIGATFRSLAIFTANLTRKLALINKSMLLTINTAKALNNSYFLY